MKSFLYFLFGFIVCLFILTLTVSLNGKPLVFLDEDFEYELWYGKYSDTWYTIRLIINILFYVGIGVFLYFIGKDNNDDNTNADIINSQTLSK